jgi:hypothetical protein
LRQKQTNALRGGWLSRGFHAAALQENFARNSTKKNGPVK